MIAQIDSTLDIVIIFRYSSLRVAYIDEREETLDGKSKKVYYSVLVKGGDKLDEVSSITIIKICRPRGLRLRKVIKENELLNPCYDDVAWLVICYLLLYGENL